MRASILIVAGLVAGAVARPTFASEPAALEELEVGRVGTASLVGVDAAEARLPVPRNREGEDESHVAGATFGTVWAESSVTSRHDGHWRRAQQLFGAGFELGVYASRWSALDVHTRGWLYLPGVEPGIAGTMRSDVRAATSVPVGGLAVDLELDGRFAMASDGERGVRRYDIAPLGYVDAAVVPTVWLASQSRDHEAFGFVFAYRGRLTRYLEGLTPTTALGDRISHGGQLGMGYRDHGAGFRGVIRWLNVGYTRHKSGSLRSLTPIPVLYLPAPPPGQNEIDATLLGVDFDFGRSDEGPHGYGRAHVAVDLGWSFLWPVADGWTHTPRARLVVDYRDPEVGQYGGAIHHRPELAPDGAMVAVTSFEANARVESNEFPLAVALLGDFARVEALPHRSRDDAWYIRGDGELYAHLHLVDVGAEGSLGRGLPTGSLGFAPSRAVPRFWGRAGAFMRVRTPF